MPYEFGDVVLVPFPFTSQATSKRRPAVVVSNQVYNLSRPDVVLMAVTSQTRAVTGSGEVAIAHWRQAGLVKPSVVKPVFATLELTLIIRRLGILDADDRAALQNAITSVLGGASGA